MPLNGIGSYLPMMDEFGAHWEDVNAELGGAPATDMKLQAGYTRAMFLADQSDLAAAITGLVDLENAREIGVADRDQKKAIVLGRINQFRGLLRGLLPNSIYASAAPLVPNAGAAESKFLAPFDDMASLWARINADVTIPGFTPPLLMGTVSLAAFVGELAAVRTAYATVSGAESDLEIGRKRRDAMLPLIRERMVQYRELVPALLGPDHPLSLSLPTITGNPGSTPDAVTLSGQWDLVLFVAQLSWTASTNPNLQTYQLRGCNGPTYDEDESFLITNISPGVLTVPTLFGLVSPGDQATFKIIVILTTGNQASSNPVTVTRV